MCHFCGSTGPFEYGQSCYSGKIFPFCADNFNGHDCPNSGSNFPQQTLYGIRIFFFCRRLASLLGLSFLSGLDWDNKSTGSDFPPTPTPTPFLESFNILLRLLDGDTFRCSHVKCQFHEFEFQKRWRDFLVLNSRNQFISEPFQSHGFIKLAFNS